jgi:cytochrome c biogenesis protein CcdA
MNDRHHFSPNQKYPRIGGKLDAEEEKMFVWGYRLFGRSDVIKGVGYVATEFLHASYFPLWPCRTYFIFQGGTEGVEIPLRFKSVFEVYLRAITLVVGFALIAGGLLFVASPTRTAQPENRQLALTISAIFVAVGFVLGASTFLLRSFYAKLKPEQQAQLMADAGLQKADQQDRVPS